MPSSPLARAPSESDIPLEWRVASTEVGGGCDDEDNIPTESLKLVEDKRNVPPEWRRASLPDIFAREPENKITDAKKNEQVVSAEAPSRLMSEDKS